jgi:hypothetical protein
MLYFYEITARVLYLFYSCFISFLLLFFFKEHFFYLLLYKIISISRLNVINSFENSFFLHSPYQLIDININVFINFILFFLFIPFSFFNLYFFFRSSIKRDFIQIYEKKLYNLIFIFYFINYLFISEFLPFFWLILDLINFEIFYFLDVNIEYEPDLFKYIFFLCSLLKLINLIFFFAIISLNFLLLNLSRNVFFYFFYIRLLKIFFSSMLILFFSNTLFDFLLLFSYFFIFYFFMLTNLKFLLLSTYFSNKYLNI